MKTTVPVPNEFYFRHPAVLWSHPINRTYAVIREARTAGEMFDTISLVSAAVAEIADRTFHLFRYLCCATYGIQVVVKEIWGVGCLRAQGRCMGLKRESCKVMFLKRTFFPNDDPYQHQTKPVCYTGMTQGCVQNFAVVRRAVSEEIANTHNDSQIISVDT